MAHRRTEGVDAVRDVAEHAGAKKVTFSFTGYHQVAEIAFGGRTRKVFFSCTSSDRNGHKQAARMARKVFAELGATS